MKVILDDDGRPLAVDVVIDAYLNGLGRTGLRALVLDLAATSAEARRVLRLRASPAGSDVQRELIGQIDWQPLRRITQFGTRQGSIRGKVLQYGHCAMLADLPLPLQTPKMAAATSQPRRS